MGGLAGVGLLYALRPVIAAVSSSALGVPQHIPGLIALVAAVTAGSALCVLLFGAVALPRASVRRHSRSSWWVLGIASALFIAGIVISNEADINTKILAVVLISAALCVAGSQWLRVIPNRHGPSPWVLAVRRVRGEGRGATVTLIALSVLLSSGFALITLYASDSATSNEQIVERMPPGQAYFEPPEPDDALLRQIEDYLGVDAATPFAFIAADTAQMNGLAIAVPSASDVERLITRPLTSGERSALQSGGALLTTSASGGSLKLSTDDGHEVDWPGVVMQDVPASFRRLSGIVLQRTAENADLPLVRRTWAFTGLTASQLEKVDSAPQDLGFDAQWLEGYRVPDTYSVSDEVLLMLGVLMLVGACVIVAYSAGTTRALRPRVSGLMAVGLGRGWLARAVAGEISLVVVLAIVTAAVAAALGVTIAIAIGAVPLHLSVPWGLIGLVTCSFLVVACGAAAMSIRRLRPEERNGW